MLRSSSKRLFVSGRVGDVYGGRLVRLPASVKSARSSAYAAAVLADTPKVFWKCQEASGNPVDSSGNGLDATSIQRKLFYRQAGPFGSDYSILLASNCGWTRSVVTGVTNNLSIEFWIYVECFGANNWNSVFLNGSSSLGYGIDLQTNGKLIVFVEGVAGLASFTNALTAGTWAHIVVVRDSGTWKYYFNGASDNANAGNSGPNNPAGQTTRTIPAANDTGIIRLAYVALYETALSPTKVSNHYNATA